METIQNAISKMKRTDQSSWIEVVVEVSAVKIVLVDQKVGMAQLLDFTIWMCAR